MLLDILGLDYISVRRRPRPRWENAVGRAAWALASASAASALSWCAFAFAFFAADSGGAAPVSGTSRPRERWYAAENPIPPSGLMS